MTDFSLGLGLFFAIFFLLFIVFLFLKKELTIYYLPIFLLVLDFGKSLFYHSDSIYGYTGFETLFFLIFIIYSFNIYHTKIFKFSFILIIFLVYLFFRLDLSVIWINKLARYSTVLFPFLLIPISYLATNSEKKFLLSIKLISLYLTIYIVFTIFVSLFKIGPNMYGTGIIYGLEHDQTNTPAVLISILFLCLPIVKRKKILSAKFIYFLFLAVVLILVLTLKRTPLLIIFSNVIFYYVLRGKNLKNTILFLPLILIFYLGSSQFVNLLTERREFSESYDYEKEGRYIEYFGVWEVLSASEIAILFGTGDLFDSAGKYNLWNKARPLHSSYSQILFGSGIIGVLLFIVFFITLLKKSKQYYDKTNKDSKDIIILFIVQIISYLLISFAGGLRYTGYTGVAFIYIGSFLGYLRFQKFNKLIKNE